MQVREWLPDQPTRVGRIDWPKEGDNGTCLRLRSGHVVVFDRQPWRLLEVHEYRDHPWPSSYEKAWREHVELWRHSEDLRRTDGRLNMLPPDRADFYKRPVILVLRNETFPRSAPKHWCAPVSHSWQVLPEHYVVCRACGELPPCHNGEYRGENGPRRAAQSEGTALCIPPGCCIGCAEPVKPRMRTVRFPGPNLWYPDLGEGSAVFHARAACADQVECYRMQWKAEYAATMPQVAPTLWGPGGRSVTLPQTRTSPDFTKPAEGWDVPAASAAEAPVPVPSAAHPEPAADAARPAESASPEAPAPAADPAPAAPAAAPAPSASAAQAAPQKDSSDAPLPALPSGHAPAAPAASAASAASTASAASAASTASTASTAEPAAEPAAPAAAPVEGMDAMRRLAEDLNTSLTDRPAFHDAEQAARVIEELTAAVRNIALCLNGTGLRPRP